MTASRWRGVCDSGRASGKNLWWGYHF